MNAPTAGSVADQLLIDHIASTVAERVRADLDRTYQWAEQVAVPSGWVTDPMLAVHQRAEYLDRLLDLHRATRPACDLEDGAL